MLEPELRMTEEVYGLPPPEPPKDAPSVSTLLLIGGLMLSAIVFVIVGLGFVVGWWGPNAKTEPVAQEQVVESTKAEPAEPEPVVLPGAEVMPTVESVPRPSTVEFADLAGAEPVPEIPPRGARGQSGGGSSEGDTAGTSNAGAVASKPKPARVRVEFVLGHYEHVEIKLGGKVFKLDGGLTLELPPGGYRVELRKAPELPWKPAGLIELQLGTRYRVTLFDPPLAKLEVVEG
jgi:hypothetical protein